MRVTQTTVKLPQVLLIIAALLLAPASGYLIGVKNYMPAIMLVGIAMFGLGVTNWRWLLLIVAPVIWSWTLLDLPLVTSSVERIVALAAMTGFVYEWATRKKELPLLPNHGVAAVGIFTVVLMLGLAVATTPAGTARFFRLVQKFGWGYLVFYALIDGGIPGVKLFARMFMVATLVASIAALLALIHFGLSLRLTSLDSVGIWEFLRLLASALNQSMAILVFPIIEASVTNNRLRKVALYALFIFFVIMAVLGPANRSVLVFAPVILGYLILFSPGGTRDKLTSLAVMIGLIFFFYNWVLVYNPLWQHRYNQLINRTLTPEEARYSQLETGLKIIEQRPILGYGLGQSEDVYAVANIVDIHAVGAHSSHNSFLSMLIDVGLVGLIAIGLFWAHLIIGALTVWRRKTESDYLNAILRLLPLMMAGLIWWWNITDAIRHNFSWTVIGFFWAVIWLAQHDGKPLEGTAPQQAAADVHP